MYDKVSFQISFKENQDLLNTGKIGDYSSKIIEYFDESRIISGASLFRNTKQKLYLTIDDDSFQFNKYDVPNISDVIKTCLFCFTTLEKVFGVQQKPKLNFRVYCSYSYGKKIIKDMTSIPDDILSLADDIRPDAIGLTLSKNGIEYQLFINTPNKGLGVVYIFNKEIENGLLLEELLVNNVKSFETDIIPSFEKLIEKRKLKR